jgi:hypothetical protein
MNDTSLDQDFSWIKEQKTLQDIQNNYSREPMEYINVKYIYINQNNYISKITCEKKDLQSSKEISQEQILHMIEKNKIQTPSSKYRIKEVLLFSVTLEPENIQGYSKNDNFIDVSSPFLKKVSILGQINIPESIFVFHEINSLYFIFQEYEIISKHLVKPILKKETDIREPLIKNTKRVRISTKTLTKHSGTRRNR